MNGQINSRPHPCLRRQCRQRHGATVVEFALVSTVFFVTIFTCIEFARVNMIQHLAKDAAYESARLCMVQGSIKQEAVDEANRILGSLGVNGINVKVTPYSHGNNQPEISDDTTELTVEINIPMSANTYLIPWFLVDFDIESTTTLAFETYGGYYDGS